MKYLLNISYDGSDFCGYATQSHKQTVQDNIESALCQIYKQVVKTKASSRTDSKVHAINQYITFNEPDDITLNANQVLLALNRLIKPSILIKSVIDVESDYNLRTGVDYKTYKYIITTKYDPLVRNYKYYDHHQFDINNLQKIANYLIGEHDFTSFCNSRSTVENKIRTIYDIQIKQVDDEYIFYIKGNGFLYNMVRIIVGTVLEIARKKIDPKFILKILDDKDRKSAFKTAPAHGLYLNYIHLCEEKAK